MLVTDNLSSTSGRGSQWDSRLKETTTLPWRGPPGTTHVWQMCDRGLIKLFKDCLISAQDKYLSKSRRLAKFRDASASERRVLLTKWVGAAWRTVCAGYQDSHYKVAQRSGEKGRARLYRTAPEGTEILANKGLAARRAPPQPPRALGVRDFGPRGQRGIFDTV